MILTRSDDEFYEVGPSLHGLRPQVVMPTLLLFFCNQVSFYCTVRIKFYLYCNDFDQISFQCIMPDNLVVSQRFQIFFQCTIQKQLNSLIVYLAWHICGASLHHAPCCIFSLVVVSSAEQTLPSSDMHSYLNCTPAFRVP